MVTEKVYKSKQRTRTQEWCHPALLPEIHVPIMPKCSPGGAAIRGDQGTDRPAQWVLKTHQVNSVFCFPIMPKCFMFHVSCFMFHVSCLLFHASSFLCPCHRFPVPVQESSYKYSKKKNSARFQPSNFQKAHPLDTMFHLEVIFI